MGWEPAYRADAPTRAEIDAMAGTTVLEFGTDWCGHCQAAAPHVEAALVPRADVQHVKVEDGRGRRLGRSFAVKLWPTLVLMRDGYEVARIVRPRTRSEVDALLAAGAAASGASPDSAA